MVLDITKYKTRCCQSYIDAEQCKRCPFKQIEDAEDQKAALNQCACDAHIGGTYHYTLRKPLSNKQDSPLPRGDGAFHATEGSEGASLRDAGEVLRIPYYKAD